MKLKDAYNIGDTVVDLVDHNRGIVISVTSKVLKVKMRYSTTIYSDIKDVDSFKNEIKVLGNISYTLRYNE